MFERARAKCAIIRDRVYDPNETSRAIFTRQVASCAGADRVLLELGCGRKARLLKAVGPKYRLALGLDLELSKALRLDRSWAVINAAAERIPVKSRIVDVVASIHVIEHLPDPQAVLVECGRILRPGGKLVVLTVNKWFPPIAVGRILPHRLRTRINRIASGTQRQDTFPAYYRANTMTSLRRAAQHAGFSVEQLRYVSIHPHYFTFSVWLYRVATLLERATRMHPSLARFQNFMLGVFVRS